MKVVWGSRIATWGRMIRWSRVELCCARRRPRAILLNEEIVQKHMQNLAVLDPAGIMINRRSQAGRCTMMGNDRHYREFTLCNTEMFGPLCRRDLGSQSRPANTIQESKGDIKRRSSCRRNVKITSSPSKTYWQSNWERQRSCRTFNDSFTSSTLTTSHLTNHLRGRRVCSLSSRARNIFSCTLASRRCLFPSSKRLLASAVVKLFGGGFGLRFA